MSDEGRMLRILGLDASQDRLVLSDDDGARFLASVDQATAAIAARSAPGSARRPGTTRGAAAGEDSMNPAGMRPREIQARIRAGASIDDVVAESGLTRDHVERYAQAMLDERSYVASLATETEVRRGDGLDVTLAVATTERLDAVGVASTSTEWDAWRREDGRWVVRLRYLHGREERQAHWVFDPKARSLVIDDVEARWLVDPTAPEPAAEQRASKPRLASVVTLDSRETQPTDLDEVDELEPVDEDEPPTAEPTLVEVVDDEPTPASGVDAPSTSSPEAAETGSQESFDGMESSPATKRTSKKRGRAEVPSWDDIVFGSRRPQD